MASKFVKELKQEVKARLASYKARKLELQGAAAEIVELNALIAEAQTELAAFTLREPDAP